MKNIEKDTKIMLKIYVQNLQLVPFYVSIKLVYTCVQSDMNRSVNESDKHKNLRSELGEKT